MKSPKTLAQPDLKFMDRSNAETIAIASQIFAVTKARSPFTHPEGDRIFSARVVVAHSEYKNDDCQANNFQEILQS